MVETIEQYMSKTRADYGSGIARPKIEDKDSFELKGQFLKEQRDNIFGGSDHEEANEHIEKVLEIVNLFHIPNITQDQVMLQAFSMSLTEAASHWLRNKPSGSITTWEDLKTKFLSKYCPPARTAKKMEEINNFQQEPDETLYQAWEQFKELLMKFPIRQILDSKGVIPSKTVADAKVAVQEMAEYSQKWHNGTSRTRSTETFDGLAAIQAQLNNLGRKIKKVNKKVYAAQVGCEQCKGPHCTKYCPLKEEDKTVKYPKGIAVNVLVGIGDEKIIFKSVKPTSSLIKRVYMLSLKERIELDLEARLMGETLVLNRSLDPLNGDYIELNVLNKPLELKRDQVDDLMPTIKEGEVIDAPMDNLVNSKNDKLDTGIDDYLSCCDYDKKIRIDYARNLKFSCMIGFEFIHVNFFPILYVNVMSKKFYNSIMKDKLEYKGNNVLGALMNVPIFVGTFSVLIDFAVLEDMDAYRDKGMGDVIVGEPFLREIRIKA
ncbi:reverse transcriptase domain-containing protein [Tanacetum coccineum]